MEIDLVNAHDLSFFVYANDSAYGKLPESSKHYSLQQHFMDLKDKKGITDWDSYFNPTSSKDFDKYFSLISLRIFRKLIDHYWKCNVNFSIVDVGCQYGFFSMKLGKYIKGHNHSNKIYSFDCGNAGKLTEFNIKLNQLNDLITFDYKAISNVSLPHLVYHDEKFSADNHIVKRPNTNLPSYVVDGMTLDDYFSNHDQQLLLKIDTQGVEPLVFEGMKNILESKSPPILFEFVPWVCKQIMNPSKFLKGLPNGYKIFNVGHDGGLTEIKYDEVDNFIDEISLKDPHWTDLLAIHETTPESNYLINTISKYLAL